MYLRHFELFAETAAGRWAEDLLLTHDVKPEEIFRVVFSEVNFALPYLVDGAKYTTEMLCEPDFWNTWLPAETYVAGMCLAFLVRNRVVKLHKHWTPKGGGKAEYRTTPTLRIRARKATKITPALPTGRVLQLMRDRKTPWL